MNIQHAVAAPQLMPFSLTLDQLDVLLNAVVGRQSNGSNLDPDDVRAQELPGQLLHLLGPRGAPHERLPVGADLGNNAAQLHAKPRCERGCDNGGTGTS